MSDRQAPRSIWRLSPTAYGECEKEELGFHETSRRGETMQCLHCGGQVEKLDKDA